MTAYESLYEDRSFLPLYDNQSMNQVPSSTDNESSSRSETSSGGLFHLAQIAHEQNLQAPPLRLLPSILPLQTIQVLRLTLIVMLTIYPTNGLRTTSGSLGDK